MVLIFATFSLGRGAGALCMNLDKATKFGIYEEKKKKRKKVDCP